LLGRCFSSWQTSCFPDLFFLLGEDAPGVWSNTARIGFEFAAFVVIAPSFYAMYSSRLFAALGARQLSASVGRTFRFFGRVAIAWIIISLPIWIGEFLRDWVLSPGLPRALTMAIYFGVLLISLLCMSALRARLVLYLPSVAYDPQPRTLGRCWQASGTAAVRLFAMFFLIDFVTLAIQIVGIIVCYRFYYQLGLDSLVNWLHRSYGSDQLFLRRTVAEAIMFVLQYAPASLLEAAISIVAYRRLFAGGEQTIATVFD
jgi:hypothetical protein